MSTQGSAGNLVQAIRNLTLHWEQTKASWHDIKSQEFERTYIEPLPAHLTRALTVMEEIENLLKKVEHDCE